MSLFLSSWLLAELQVAKQTLKALQFLHERLQLTHTVRRGPRRA